MQIINYRGKLIEIAAVKMELISLEEPWLIWKDENIITLTITRSRGRDMYGFLRQEKTSHWYGEVSHYDRLNICNENVDIELGSYDTCLGLTFINNWSICLATTQMQAMIQYRTLLSFTHCQYLALSA
jgi:hypothetical protein